MMVSTNQGTAWGGKVTMSQCKISGGEVWLQRSPANQDVLYQAGRGTAPPPYDYTLLKSSNRGANWSVLWACAASPTMTQHPGVYIWNPLSAFMAAGDDGLHWTENDWASYVTHHNALFDVDGCSRVMDYPENLYGSRASNPTPTRSQHVIFVSSTRGDTWEGKAGASPATAPYTGSIPNTCGGVADILQIWTG